MGRRLCLPMAMGGLYAYFDLGQLREPAHFSAKPKIIASMGKWAYRIDELDGPIKLSLGHYVEEFNYEIRDLYFSFLSAIQKHIGGVSKSFYRMLSRHPSYVRIGPDGGSFVFYEEGGLFIWSMAFRTEWTVSRSASGNR